jgi:signal transduction histidine kinase
MKVARRLLVAVLPAVPGVLAMAGPACRGQRGGQIPGWILLAGIVLALAWQNTRYVARRIAALSRRRGAGAEGDDPAGGREPAGRTIPGTGQRGEPRERAAEARLREYARLLADASATAGRKLDEARLPLHILLSSPFGELNENQEEMIGAAQAAVEEAGAALRTIGRIAELDEGRVESRPERVRPRDLLAPVIAAVGPRLEQAGATLELDLPLTLPHVQADPRHAREALSLVLNGLAEGAGPGARVRVEAGSGDGFVRLRIAGGSLRRDGAFALAERLLQLQGGVIRDSGESPTSPPSPTRGAGRAANDEGQRNSFGSRESCMIAEQGDGAIEVLLPTRAGV